MSDRPRAAVVTIVHGRHLHLRRQLQAMSTLVAPGPQIVVAMGDPLVAPEVDRQPRPPGGEVLVIDLDTGDGGGLPLARARNAGARAALAQGAELLVFLDVDCLPEPRLVVDYQDAVSRGTKQISGPVLWCGEVAYLPPLPDGVRDYPLGDLPSWASPHAARPVVEAGGTRFSDDLRLFWSLNFAITAADWLRSGGFHPGFVGYGGEDTDFAMTVGAQDGAIGWVGGARAYHQYHPTTSPPWQHLDAIVGNAWVFRRRWGWFPMEGWLTEFAAAGAVDFRPVDDVLEITRP